jgi:hypothetical protein
MTEKELIEENRKMKVLLNTALIIYSHKSVNIRNNDNAKLATQLKKEIKAVLNVS